MYVLLKLRYNKSLYLFSESKANFQFQKTCITWEQRPQILVCLIHTLNSSKTHSSV